MGSRLRVMVGLCSLLAVAGAVHSAFNVRRLPRPPRNQACEESVAILVPARNEADRLPATLRSLVGQRGLSNAQITVLDDSSDDGTGDIARTVLADCVAADSAVTGEVLRGDENPPAGWLGKPWACARLADTTVGRAAEVVVFVDADVILAPDAVAAAIAELRRRNLDLLSPWPRQVAHTWLERLVQPLQQWSWATTVPLTMSEDRQLPSLSAANGQFLVVDNSAYRRCGGHHLVRDQVLEDILLARRMRAFGLRTGLADGSQIAECRMYDGAAQVLAGYRKSLWAAFGSANDHLPVLAGKSLATIGALILVETVPAIAALTSRDRLTRAFGLAGYLGAAAGRAVVAARTAGRVFPDSALQPVSVAVLAGMAADSLVARARGRASWKGRSVRPSSGSN